MKNKLVLFVTVLLAFTFTLSGCADVKNDSAAGTSSPGPTISATFPPAEPIKFDVNSNWKKVDISYKSIELPEEYIDWVQKESSLSYNSATNELFMTLSLSKDDQVHALLMLLQDDGWKVVGSSPTNPLTTSASQASLVKDKALYWIYLSDANKIVVNKYENNALEMVQEVDAASIEITGLGKVKFSDDGDILVSCGIMRDNKMSSDYVISLLRGDQSIYVKRITAEADKKSTAECVDWGYFDGVFYSQELFSHSDSNYYLHTIVYNDGTSAWEEKSEPILVGKDVLDAGVAFSLEGNAYALKSDKTDNVIYVAQFLDDGSVKRVSSFEQTEHDTLESVYYINGLCVTGKRDGVLWMRCFVPATKKFIAIDGSTLPHSEGIAYIPEFQDNNIVMYVVKGQSFMIYTISLPEGLLNSELNTTAGAV